MRYTPLALAMGVAWLLTSPGKTVQAAEAEPERIFQIVPTAAEALETARRWAVLIAVGDYQNEEVNDLRYTVQDAQALRDLLIDPQRCGFQEEQVLLLADGQPAHLRPTLRNVLRVLNSLKKEAKGADTVLLFFTGHGLSTREESYLMPSDAPPEEELLTRFGIQVAELREVLDAIQPQVGVIILDACRVEPLKAKSLGGEMDAAFERAIAALEGEGRAIFSACKLGQKSYESEEFQHGVFSHYLTEALRGPGDRDGDGLIELEEVKQYVTDQVQRWAREHGKEQDPEIDMRVAGRILLAQEPRRRALALEKERLARFRQEGGLSQAEAEAAAALLQREFDGQALSEIEQQCVGLVHQLAAERLTPADYRARVQDLTRPRYGTLRVNAEPWAEVALDGQTVGETPLTLQAVPVGEHRLRVAREGYEPVERAVTIREGESTDVGVTLRKK